MSLLRWSRFTLCVLPLVAAGTALVVPSAGADAGAEAASFLNIPVGGRAAALGGAYSALAVGALAPVWNPAGLSHLHGSEVAGMHLSYLESITYEFASVVRPLGPSSGFGASMQYLNPGHLEGTDENGTPIGDVGGHYLAFSGSYGLRVCSTLGIGVTAKYLHAQIDDTRSYTLAGDLGALYDITGHFHAAFVIANLGAPLRFVDARDSLPSNIRSGVSWDHGPITLTAEAAHAFSGLTSGHFGAEWTPVSVVSIRTGYRTDTVKQLSALAGLTTGVGLHLWGQEFDYAWLPLGELGTTQYFSFVLRFGDNPEGSKNLTPSKEVRARGQSYDPGHTLPFEEGGVQ